MDSGFLLNHFRITVTFICNLPQRTDQILFQGFIIIIFRNFLVADFHISDSLLMQILVSLFYRISEKVNDRWEICVSLSEGQFQQVI